jgi:hypothetical protein
MPEPSVTFPNEHERAAQPGSKGEDVGSRSLRDIGNRLV